MRVWLVDQGEKSGPHDIAEITRRIESGELEKDQHAWVEGMKEWRPLGEISFFNGISKNQIATEESLNLPPPLPNVFPLGRRFFARWFDHFSWLFLFYSLAYLFGVKDKNFYIDPIVQFLVVVVGYIIESVMIHVWRTTPGKKLLGISIVSKTGESLTIQQSLLRSMRVFIMGVGMMLPFMVPLCHGFSWWYVRKFGIALWDKHQDHRVEMKPVRPSRWILFFIIIFTASMVNGAVLAPITDEIIKEFSPTLYQLLHPASL
jgi:RDD family/GYF domain 2